MSSQNILSGEIHDTLGVCLAGIKFKVGNAQLQGGKPSNATECLNTISPLHSGMRRCRRMQMDLPPSMLDDMGLLRTLSYFCNRFQTDLFRGSDQQEMNIEEGRIPNALKIVICRVTQEAMNNIPKHSKGNLAHLPLLKLDNRMELVFQDNGQGFRWRRCYLF